MKISVIIPVYNAGRYVRQACESALSQPQTGEVILVEDGSPDDALSVCRELAAADERVKLLQHPDCGNHGAGASRNVGIQAAKYEIIAFLDADDYFLPGRFVKAMEVLGEDSTIDGVYEASRAEFENDVVKDRWMADRKTDFLTLSRRIDPERLFEAFTCDFVGRFSTDAIVVQKRIFRETGLFDTHLRLCQDTAMWLKMSAVGKLAPGSLCDPVAVWRVHGANRSVSSNREFPRSRHLMWGTVFAWSLKKKLPLSRRDILLTKYLESSEQWYFSFRSWRLRKLCALMLLGLVGLRRPGAVVLPAFRRYGLQSAKAIVGIRR